VGQSFAERTSSTSINYYGFSQRTQYGRLSAELGRAGRSLRSPWAFPAHVRRPKPLNSHCLVFTPFNSVRCFRDTQTPFDLKAYTWCQLCKIQCDSRTREIAPWSPFPSHICVCRPRKRWTTVANSRCRTYCLPSNGRAGHSRWQHVCSVWQRAPKDERQG
jgi:hypothetical protein